MTEAGIENEWTCLMVKAIDEEERWRSFFALTVRRRRHTGWIEPLHLGLDRGHRNLRAE